MIHCNILVHISPVHLFCYQFCVRDTFICVKDWFVRIWHSNRNKNRNTRIFEGTIHPALECYQYWLAVSYKWYIVQKLFCYMSLNIGHVYTYLACTTRININFGNRNPSAKLFNCILCWSQRQWICSLLMA
jgi:hypothetical protein